MSSLYIARNPRVAARMLGDEMMVMSGRDSTLFTLNKTAAILWQSADGTTPLHRIVQQRICTEFDVEHAEALQDAEILARQLAAHEIMRVSEEPILHSDASAGEVR